MNEWYYIYIEYIYKIIIKFMNEIKIKYEKNKLKETKERKNQKKKKKINFFIFQV